MSRNFRGVRSIYADTGMDDEELRGLMKLATDTAYDDPLFHADIVMGNYRIELVEEVLEESDKKPLCTIAYVYTGTRGDKQTKALNKFRRRRYF